MLPILDLRDRFFYIRVTSPIYRIKSRKVSAWIDVRNIETGEAMRIQVHTVLSDEFRSKYPNDKYIAKDFRIQAFNPQNGKNYYQYSVAEIRLTNEANEELDLLIQQSDMKQSSGANKEADKTALLLQRIRDDYQKYLRSMRWKKIRNRIWERDHKRCLRCGGPASAVHHRSYDDDVMLGKNDEKLASICDGCHYFIHFDDLDKERAQNDTEIDRLLLERNESTDFPPPKIDLRKTRREQYPSEWKRMSALQRSAYNKESQRLTYIRRLQCNPGHQIYRKFLNDLGMDDIAIDLAIADRKSGRASRKA